MEPKYKRIVLKLSGEALAGDQGYGIDPAIVNSISGQIKELVALGVEVAVVVGAGNIWRGKTGSELGMDRANADYMGMLATVLTRHRFSDCSSFVPHLEFAHFYRLFPCHLANASL